MTLSVTLRGLVHGDGSPDLSVLRASNLWIAPDLRSNDTDIPGSHGTAAGTDLYGARRVPLTVQLRAPEWADGMSAVHQRMSDVIAAWAPGSEDVELQWADDTGDYVLFGRPRQAAPNMELAGAGIVNFDCRFMATDPFIYSGAEQLAGTIAPTPSAGLVFPLVFPLVFGPPGSGGTMQVHNAGTAPSSRWIAAVGGPCSEPRLSVGGRGVTWGGDLAAGQILHIDGRGRLSGACSTSGLAYKMNGRVGDSPIIGSGLFVDDEVGAATATGLGESILKVAGSAVIVELMRHGHSPQAACEEAIRRIAQQEGSRDFQACFLALHKSGEVGACALQPGFVFTLTREGRHELVKATSYYPR